LCGDKSGGILWGETRSRVSATYLYQWVMCVSPCDEAWWGDDFHRVTVIIYVMGLLLCWPLAFSWVYSSCFMCLSHLPFSKWNYKVQEVKDDLK
jgi:hypothetical protein